MKRLILILALCLLPLDLAGQSTVTAASCNETDVIAVIHGPTHVVANGDTILKFELLR